MATPFHPADDLYEVQMDGGDIPEIELSGGMFDGPQTELDAHGPELAFLSGQRHYVISSNVEYFQYFAFHDDGSPQNVLYVGYKDGSEYSYQEISVEEALTFYRAASPGGAVWDHLRIRGTVFGFQKPYALVKGNRVWHAAGHASQLRHGAIPRTGEPFSGYHPANAFAGAPGAMGSNPINLGKKRGKKKIELFVPMRNVRKGVAS